MVKEKVHNKLEKQFRKFVKKDGKIENAYMLIHSEKHGVHLNVAEGTTGNTAAHPDQPYLITGVDKLLTSVLIAILEEQEKLSYDDTIQTYLEEKLMEDLHVIEWINYSSIIKIKHLLNHTSGLYDFMRDKPIQGEPLIHQLLEKSNELFTKQGIIEWSKENLTPQFQPEKGFHYSNTGYLLLSLIVEKITSRPFHQALHDYIFQPLQMNHTYMLQHSKPMQEAEHPLANCYIHNINVTQNERLGLDEANGRIVSTSDDLLKFMKGLVNYKLIKRESLNRMTDWAPFPIGVDYGYGIMMLKHAPLLTPQKYIAWGNAGLTGSFIFYHQDLETYFIGSLNQFRYQENAIVLMYKMIDILYK